MTLALWVLCALVAVASPTKRPVKGHAVRAQVQTRRAATSKKKPSAKAHGKPVPKSSAKSSSKSKGARRHKPKVDEADFEPPTVHRTRAVIARPVPHTQSAAVGLPAMPPTNTEKTSYIGTALSAATLPLPPQYSPVEADDDAPEVSDVALATAPAATVRPAPASRSELADEAVQPEVLPGLYSRTGRLLVPAALKGSREVLVHQNVMADAAGLSRIEDDDDLARMRRLHLLVDLPVSESLRVNPELNANRRCARPWTVKFVADTARAFHAKFGVALQVNSAVRTMAYQRRLQRTNGNAAAVEGETASPHLTGQAIDFGKRGMSLAEIAWMRAYLLPLMQAGKIDVEEEFQQACFHISVYKSYVPARRVPPKNQVAQARPPRVGRSGE
jgi:hypothetical protein